MSGYVWAVAEIGMKRVLLCLADMRDGHGRTGFCPG